MNNNAWSSSFSCTFDMNVNWRMKTRIAVSRLRKQVQIVTAAKSDHLLIMVNRKIRKYVVLKPPLVISVYCWQLSYWPAVHRGRLLLNWRIFNFISLTNVSNTRFPQRPGPSGRPYFHVEMFEFGVYVHHTKLHLNYGFRWGGGSCLKHGTSLCFVIQDWFRLLYGLSNWTWCHLYILWPSKIDGSFILS